MPSHDNIMNHNQSSPFPYTYLIRFLLLIPSYWLGLNFLFDQDNYESYSLPYTGHTGHVTTMKHVRHVPPVMIGTVRYRRDLIFSRWQDRTFVLTQKYLKCFDKMSNNSSAPTFQHQPPQLLWKVRNNINHNQFVNQLNLSIDKTE